MLAVAQISAASTCDWYKLFDPDRLSDRTDGDWHQFLARYLTHKLAQVAPYLHRDAPRFAGKVQHLLAVLDQPYCGDEHLIHGDFFPGDLLINDERQITALLDFGLLTMYGDYLFDIATSWVFFDMYNDFSVIPHAGLEERDTANDVLRSPSCILRRFQRDSIHRPELPSPTPHLVGDCGERPQVPRQCRNWQTPAR